MKILVINAGSSSLKYQLIDMDDEKVLAKGNCERIGIGGHIGHKTAEGVSVEKDLDFPTHKEAFLAVVDMLTSGEGTAATPQIALCWSVGDLHYMLNAPGNDRELLLALAAQVQ